MDDFHLNLPSWLMALLLSAAICPAATNVPLVSVFGWTPEGTIVGRGKDGSFVERRLNGTMREIPLHWLSLETLDAYDIAPKTDAEWRRLWVNNCATLRELNCDYTNSVALQEAFTNLLLNTSHAAGYQGQSIVDGMIYLQHRLKPKTAAPQELQPAQLNITDVTARVVTRAVWFATVGWKVTLINNTSQTMRDVRVRFSFRDKSEIEISADALTVPVLEPGARRVVTSTTIMNENVWDEVKNFVAQTR